jgi:putative transposase
VPHPSGWDLHQLVIDKLSHITLFGQVTKLHHFDNLGTARFVTFSCHGRRPYLNDDQSAQVFVGHLDQWRRQHNMRLMGYVIMPEHVHLVIVPPESCQLGTAVGRLKGLSARRIGLKTEFRSQASTFWLKRCYDHNCRTPETTIEKINYCHHNPVARGLVSHAREWPWSSYRWYHGMEDALIEIDELGDCDRRKIKK